MYYNVGKLIIDAQGGEERAKYADGLIKEYSKKLTFEVNRKYGERNLRNMRKFYLLFKDKQNWTHYRVILKMKDVNEINYYINQIKIRNLSKRELQEIIKLKEYQRLDENTKNKLLNKEEEKIEDFLKNPILIKNSEKQEISEKLLKSLILEYIDNF